MRITKVKSSLLLVLILFLLGGCSSKTTFDGTFDKAHWPTNYGNCYLVSSPTEASFNINNNCNPGGDGHYRTDLCSSPSCNPNESIGEVYRAGQPTCTTIPVNVDKVPIVPTSSWLQFAEAKDNAANLAGWGMGLTSYWSKTSNEFMLSYSGYADSSNPGGIAYHGRLISGWNTITECDNNANDNSGQVYYVGVNGNRVTFNFGRSAGSQSLKGFPIINDGAKSWPLDVNDYNGSFGGSCASHPCAIPNTVLHRDPTVVEFYP